MLAEEKSNDSQPPNYQRKKTGVAKPLEATAPGSKLEPMDMCKVDGTPAVPILVMFVTGAARSRTAEADCTINFDSSL